MQTRKEMLFDAGQKPSMTDVVPAKVVHKIDKSKGALEIKTPEQKMVIALKKVLAEMSDDNIERCRFYIADNKIKITQRPFDTGEAGTPQSYFAEGRCKVGICHPEGHKSSKVIAFSITFKDVKDDLELDDVEFIQPTTVDTLPKSTRIE